MKVRFAEGRVRIRITEDELERLNATGRLEEGIAGCHEDGRLFPVFVARIFGAPEGPALCRLSPGLLDVQLGPEDLLRLNLEREEGIRIVHTMTPVSGERRHVAVAVEVDRITTVA